MRPRNTEIEHWKSFLITSPDNVFFDLMRRYLGNIRTPFNKHDLIKRLIAYLRSKETRKRLVSLITNADAYLITAIDVLHEPELAKLYAFVGVEYQYLELHSHLLNLEERLIIYREQDGQALRIKLNPVFLQDLHEFVIDPNLLFPSQKRQSFSQRTPWINDTLLVSFLSFVNQNPALFKLNDSLRKRIETEVKSRIPGLTEKNQGITKIRALAMALIGCNLLVEDAGAVAPQYIIWENFGLLSEAERVAYVAAGLVLHTGAIDSRNLSSTASFITTLFERLSDDREYSAETIHRLRQVITGPEVSVDGTAAILQSLCTFDLLTQEEELYGIVPLASDSNGAANEPSIVIQPNFEITVKKNAEFSQSIVISQIADLIRHDIYSLLELNKESVSRSYALGRTGQEIIEILETMSGKSLPPNVSFSIDSWENEHRSVRLFHGTALIIDTERQHFIEHGEAIQNLVTESPAPGVYLLNTSDPTEIKTALEECGIEQTPSFEDLEIDPYQVDTSKFFCSLGATALNLSKERPRERDSASHLIEELNDVLRSLDIDEDAKTELSERIEKRLILFPEQLRLPVETQGEKSEARGFDYVGKVRIIEQALRRDNLMLEILSRSKGGDPVRYLAKPLDLEKSGNNLILAFIALPEQDEKKIRVRTISLIRTVKSSLFVPT